jgi:hypothetical protein
MGKGQHRRCLPLLGPDEALVLIVVDSCEGEAARIAENWLESQTARLIDTPRPGGFPSYPITKAVFTFDDENPEAGAGEYTREC